MTTPTESDSLEEQFKRYVAERERRWRSANRFEESKTEFDLLRDVEQILHRDVSAAIAAFNTRTSQALAVELYSFDLVHPSLASVRFVGPALRDSVLAHIAQTVPWFTQLGIELRLRH